MKLVDVIRLAWRNLINNFTHFGLSLLSIVMLSVLIMTACNFCWNCHVNIDKNVVNETNQEGAYVEVYNPKKIYNSFNGIGYDESYFLTSEEISDFVNLADELDIDTYCKIRGINIAGSAYIDNESIQFCPYIGRFKPKNDFKIIEGEMWSKEDEGKDYIWLTEFKSVVLGKSVGDTVEVNFVDKDDSITNTVAFTIKGITDDYYSYVDIKHYETRSIAVYNPKPEYKTAGEISKIVNIVKKSDNQHPNATFTTSLEHNAYALGDFIYGLMAAIIILSLGVCLVCIVNTLKISIEKSNGALGVLKALGMKSREMKEYVLIQIGFFVVVATLIAVVISCLLSYLALSGPSAILMTMLFSQLATPVSTTTFWFVLPIINIIVLGLTVGISAIPMLNKYTKRDAIKIMSEGNL